MPLQRVAKKQRYTSWQIPKSRFSYLNRKQLLNRRVKYKLYPIIHFKHWLHLRLFSDDCFGKRRSLENGPKVSRFLWDGNRSSADNCRRVFNGRQRISFSQRSQGAKLDAPGKTEAYEEGSPNRKNIILQMIDTVSLLFVTAELSLLHSKKRRALNNVVLSTLFTVVNSIAQY